MGKTICVALLTLMVFICDIANACVSGIGRSEGTNRYTSTTVCQTGNLGAFMVGGGSSNGGSSYTPPEYYAAMKENAKKEEEGKRAYCKANNYPTHVPFCAGYKEQAIQACKQDVNQRYDLAVSDANKRMISGHADCDKTYSTTWLSASHTACINQSNGHFNGAISGIEEDKKIRLGNCSNM